MDSGRQLKLWPVHPAPRDDELLSSWMVRLAHGNGFKVQAFYAAELGRDAALWNRDIDRCARDDLVERLAARTGRAPDEVERLTLRSLEGYLAEDLRVQKPPWVLSLGAYHRTRKRACMMFCPQCLRADAEPYLRKAWRLAYMTCCTLHGCTLLDRCAACGAYVQAHRIDMVGHSILARGISLATCHRCRADLRRSASPPAMDALLALQGTLERVLTSGYADFAGNPALHSLSFFGGLHRLVRGLLMAKPRGQQNSRLFRDIPMRQPLEWLSVDARRQVMEVAGRAIERWPMEFLRFCEGLQQPFHAFRPEEHTPYWFGNVVDQRLRRAHTEISQAEAEYVAEATAAVTGRFRQREARRLFQRHVERHVRWMRPALSSEDVQEFVDGIDHAVAGVSGDQRLDYLRDKAMLVTARVLGLKQHALAALALDDMPKLVERPRGSRRLAAMPTKPRQLYPWLRWYLDEVRPRYPNADQAPELFLCRNRRGRMSESLIGSRFTQLLRTSYMHHRVHDYAHWIRK